MIDAVAASAAVVGQAAVATVLNGPDTVFQKLTTRKTGTHARLSEILKAVTDNPFAREWWDAVWYGKDVAALKKLLGDALRSAG